MSRAFQVARPEDTLGTTIRRLTAGRGLALIPITDSGRVVGIVSVQNLMSSMSLLAEQRRLEREEAREDCHDSPWPADPESPLAPGLYLVATPIGNLGDITLRALDVLRRVDRIACEDTRQTQKLLNHFEITTPTVSCHQHNEHHRATELIEALKAGGRIALVSDAGMPGISDPGGWLAAEAIAAGVAVIPIPGANAALSALVASGLPTGEFHFIGFLPEKAGARRTRLEALAAEVAALEAPRTLIFYEAPHRILETLADLEAVWGPSLRVVLARELTKIHEEFLRGTVAEARRESGRPRSHPRRNHAADRSPSRAQPKSMTPAPHS